MNGPRRVLHPGGCPGLGKNPQVEIDRLLRAYRVGHAGFSDWVLRELARQAAEAEMIDAATLSMPRVGWWPVLRSRRIDRRCGQASIRIRYAAGRSSR